MLGKKSLPPGTGLLIWPCCAVHSFGMRFSFDALYVGRSDRVICVVEEMPRNRLGPIRRRASYVVELPAGTVKRTGTRPGDQLEVVACPD